MFIVVEPGLTYSDAFYHSFVTATTVGYGDIAPATVLGKILASISMLTGYSIIAVPTGIISVELGKAVNKEKNLKIRICGGCDHESHDKDAVYCKICGTKI